MTCDRVFSRYLAMRDGVRLAADVYLPQTAERVPTILRQTRYFRAVRLNRWWASLPGDNPFDDYPEMRRRFLRAGYAWIDVDVRGSGASFGNRPCPWSPDEVKDSGDVVDWLVAQPWSNGLVGSLGTSYDGTAAEFLLVNQHDAVRAIVPRFSLFDVFADIAFPGGVHLDWFTASWGAMNHDFDRNEFGEVVARVMRYVLQGSVADRDQSLPPLARALRLVNSDGWQRAFSRLVDRGTLGVAPVDEDPNSALLVEAVAGHDENYDVHAESQGLVHRDDRSPSDPQWEFEPWGSIKGSINRFSPHAFTEEIRQTDAAIFSYSGWLDGAYQNAAIKRFMTHDRPQDRLLIGPWEHGGRLDISPFSADRLTDFDHGGEIMRFFDHHLKNITNSEARVRYFTLGREEWRSCDRWPPETEPMTFFCAAEGKLARSPPEADAYDVHRFSPDASSGRSSRWRCLIGPHHFVGYRDRALQDRGLITYTSDALPADLEVTGHALATLHVSSSDEDGDFFVYLEDVDPAGRVTYVTEGQLRALHRKASTNKPPYWVPEGLPYHSFEQADAASLTPGEVEQIAIPLLPISYLFRAGHAVRIAIAGCDRDNFVVRNGTPHVQIHRSRPHPSQILLPIA